MKPNKRTVGNRKAKLSESPSSPKERQKVLFIDRQVADAERNSFLADMCQAETLEIINCLSWFRWRLNKIMELWHTGTTEEIEYAFKKLLKECEV